MVNVKTSGMFLRKTQNSESVPALVAHWCADKCLFARARWTRTVVFLQSCDRDRSQCCDLMTSHAWLKAKSHPHCVARIRHTVPKLGSGAMGSRFREQLTHWTDTAVFTQPDQWKGFLSAMVTVHEADILYMRNFLEEITKNKYRTTDAERPQTRHFREQREEQAVLPSVVRRVLIVGRTD